MKKLFTTLSVMAIGLGSQSQTLIEDFEGGNLNNWTVTSGGGLIATSPVNNGTFSAQIGSSLETGGLNGSYAVHNTFSAAGGEYQFSVRVKNVDQSADGRVAFQYLDSDNFYEFTMRPVGSDNPGLKLRKFVNGVLTDIESVSATGFDFNTWYDVRIERLICNGSGSIKVFVDNQLKIDAVDFDIISSGSVGIGSYKRYTYHDDIYFTPESGGELATITPQGSTTICSGGFVQLTASAGDSYLWSNGETTQTITATQAGQYTVTVSNSDGCSDTSDPITVTVNPTPNAGVTVSGATTFCSGGSVTLTSQASSGSYLWSNGETTQSITVNQTGNYSVTVTNNGCSATSGVTAVTVNPTPTASITPVGSTTFCQGGFVVLQAAGGGTYQWNTGAQSSSISVSQSGTYVVQVSQNGCTASAQQVVTVNPLPAVTLQPLSNLCQNATAVTLGGGMPMGGTYTVNGTPTNTLDPAITGSGTQTVGYSYTDNNGCSNSATQSVTVNAVPNVTLSGLNTNYALSDAPAQLAGTPTGGVYNGSGVSNGIFDPAAAGLGTHGVSYAVVDGNGCVGVAAFCTTVDINVNIGGSNIGTDGGVNVYPNPSNGQFMLELQQIEGVVSYTVYDARGREVRFGSLVAGGSRTQHGLDLSTEAKGLYTLQLQTANGTITQKLVKE